MEGLRRVGRSIWSATSSETSYRQLEGHVSVDVAVVGGGITGITTALLLVREGFGVALIEADRIASSTTGYTTAKLTSLHGLTYGPIVDVHGEEAAFNYGEANENAIRKVEELSEANGIDCDLERMPSYTYTTDLRSITKIEREVEVARGLGLPATLVTGSDLPFEIAAAVRFEEQAMFHPRKYCLGLAGLIVQEGGRIFERTTVTGIEDGKPCTVVTQSGTVRADHVVQASQLPFHDPFGFFASNVPSQSYGLAFLAQHPPPKGMYLSAELPTRSIRPFRTASQSYLIIGGEGHKVGREPDTAKRYGALTEWSKQNFNTGKPAFHWSAHDYLPSDGLPYVGRLMPESDRMWVATGFKKWGLTNGTAAAMILTDSIAGRSNPWAKTFDSMRLKPKPAAGRWVQKQAELEKSREVHPTVTVSQELDLGVDEARVFQAVDSKVAAYRDDRGKLHALSAVCTHMGCQVAFNTAEKTWDCPCHGSRFDVEGRVIHGPATNRLQQVHFT